jgi:integrase
LQKTSLTPDQIADAETALKSAPVHSIAKVISHYTTLERRANELGVSLDKAVSFAQAHYRPEITELSILNARDQFLVTRSNLAQKSLIHYQNSTRILLALGPNKPLHTVSVLDLEGVLEKYKNPNSLRSYRTGISVFFNWAERHHYVLENPCKRLDKIPADDTPVAILSLEEVKRLLKATMQYADGSMAAPLTVALFAGLRPSEIEDLLPSQVTVGKIRVTGGKMRRKINRIPPIPPNLAAWLERYPFQGLPKGALGKFKVIKRAVDAENWKQDILRHTSITYQAARDQDLAKTAINCGTSVPMLHKHYLEVIDDPKAIAEFWGLTPSSIEKEKIEIELPFRKQVAWPDDRHLGKMVRTMHLTEIARSLHVSDVAVRKRCLRRNIPMPTRRLHAGAA